MGWQFRWLHIKVVDKSGQESYKNFTIYDQDRSAETHTFTNGSLGELLRVAWPKDIISIVLRNSIDYFLNLLRTEIVAVLVLRS